MLEPGIHPGAKEESSASDPRAVSSSPATGTAYPDDRERAGYQGSPLSAFAQRQTRWLEGWIPSILSRLGWRFKMQEVPDRTHRVKDAAKTFCLRFCHSSGPARQSDAYFFDGGLVASPQRRHPF